jgi:RNA polymerase sigma-70 factor (ECF subfamily)
LYNFKALNKSTLSKELNNNVCEESVFERIYKTYAKDLHDFLYYKYGSQLNPSDKAQDAFIKLWDNCNKVTFNKAKSYLFTVANNMVLNDIKHQKVILKHHQSLSKHYTNETPEFLMEKEEFSKQFQHALQGLKEDYRVAFLLNKVEGKKHSEIADMLGVTKKVVEYRIYAAFTILKRDLKGFKIK